MRLILRFLKYAFFTSLIFILLAASLIYFFQDKIIELAFGKINQYLATKIEIDRNVELSIIEKFPEVSLKVRNVRIYESYPASDNKLAQLKTLYFAFDALSLLQGNYQLKNIYAEDGEIKIRINENGAGNYFIFKTDTTSGNSQNNLSLDLQKIILNNVQVSYVNEAIHQNHDLFAHKVIARLKLENKSWAIGVQGDVLVHHVGIGGNEYFKEKSLSLNLQQEYHEDGKIFKIAPSVLFIEGSEFRLSGLYEGNERKFLELNLNAEKTSIATLVSILPGNISKELGIYRSSGNVFFKANIKGTISAEASPEVNIDFGFSNASFFHPELDKKIENATLTGNFTNGIKNDLSSSSLSLKNFTGVFEGNKFLGNFSIENFEDPYIKLDFNGTLPAKPLLAFYTDSPIKEADGLLDLNINFEGKVSDLKTTLGKEKVKGSGTIGIHNLSLLLKDFPLDFSNVNGSLNFNKNDLIIHSLSGQIGKSDLAIKGSFKNFIYKLIAGKESLVVDASLKSDMIDLNEILKAISTKNGTNSPKGKYPYLEDYKIKINCQINKLYFNRLNAKEINGIIDFNQPALLLKEVSFKTAGGKVNFNSLLNFNSENNIGVNTKAEIENIHIDSIFYICENFNQDFLQDKNLKGEFTGNLTCYFIMNSSFNINAPSVIATIDATIKNGALNNFEPMKKLSRFIDEKQLENIRFSELKNKIYIENNKITIPEMQIKSNISTISVMGTQTFDNEMDYKLAIPVKDFKKKHPDKDEAFGAVEEDNNGNSTLFLIIKGTTSNYKISYDTKRTGKKIKEDLKKEKKELEDLFKRKRTEQMENIQLPEEQEYFDF